MTTVQIELTEEQKAFLDKIALRANLEVGNYPEIIKSLLEPIKVTSKAEGNPVHELRIRITEKGGEAMTGLLKDLSDQRIAFFDKTFSPDQSLSVLVRPGFHCLDLLLQAYKKGNMVDPRKLFAERRDNVVALFPDEKGKW